MTCEILSVGTELLLGNTLNTNARFIAKELAKYGVTSYFQTTVGDNPERMREAFEAAFRRADTVITSGGLGPTCDDLTKEVGCEVLGAPLVRHEESFRRIKSFFDRRNVPMTDNNIKQALLPEGCVVMPNDNGTAPGFILERDGKTLIELPGPPSEMEPMFKAHVAPYLEAKSDCVFVSRTILFAGIGESAMEDKLADLMRDASNPTVAPYAKATGCTARLTARAATREEGLAMIKPVADEIYRRLGEHVFGEDDMTVQEAVVGLLKARGLTLATAESCTGGLVSSMITDVSGSSEVFVEGCVTYSNEAKSSRLGVAAATLERFGAVSPQTASEMAAGVVRNLGASIGLSLTGIAGPTGGTAEKPVGLVYVGLSLFGETTMKELRLGGNRAKIRARAATEALFWLLAELKKGGAAGGDPNRFRVGRQGAAREDMHDHRYRGVKS